MVNIIMSILNYGETPIFNGLINLRWNRGTLAIIFSAATAVHIIISMCTCLLVLVISDNFLAVEDREQ